MGVPTLPNFRFDDSLEVHRTQDFYLHFLVYRASLVAQMVRNLPPMQETWVWSLGQEDPLEKEVATHSTILPWEISWTEKPGVLQSMGLQTVGHDWTTTCGVQDLSSLARDRTHASCSGSPESEPLYLQGSLSVGFLFFFFSHKSLFRL